MGRKEKMVESREQFVEEALAQYEGPLIGYALGILRDLDRARDVVQDTFIRLYQQDREKVQRGLKTWLFTVCRNRALDILRKEKRMVALEDERPPGWKAPAHPRIVLRTGTSGSARSGARWTGFQKTRDKSFD